MFPLQLRLLTSWRYELLRARMRSFTITLLHPLDHGTRSLGLPFTHTSHCYGLCLISYLACPFSCSLRMVDSLLLLNHALVTCSSSCMSHMLVTIAILSLSMTIGILVPNLLWSTSMTCLSTTLSSFIIPCIFHAFLTCSIVNHPLIILDHRHMTYAFSPLSHLFAMLMTLVALHLPTMT